jgi:hypothetical protein
MRKLKRVTLALALIALVGCATTTIESKVYRSYAVGETKTATIGDAFLVDQNGSVSTVRKWVGILNSPDGWQDFKVSSEDYIRRELLYSGRSADTIKVSYREFRGGMAAPAFFQNVEYDLSTSKTIKFRRFTIDVISATNQSITYKVVSDQ